MTQEYFLIISIGAISCTQAKPAFLYFCHLVLTIGFNQDCVKSVIPLQSNLYKSILLQGFEEERGVVKLLECNWKDTQQNSFGFFPLFNITALGLALIMS